MVRIAIVGLGPWGVCALERLVTAARGGFRPGREVEVHVIEPGTPGSGVYDVSQPDYLLLNNACGQLSLYPFASDAGRPGYGVGLYEWAVAQGYRWVGDCCVADPAGAPIEPHHFLPRRLMGEYLHWFYRALVAAAPASLRIVHHPISAVDIVRTADGREDVCLDDGGTVSADHVIVTSGHTANQEGGDGGSHPPELSPYPVMAYVQGIPAGATVAVSGMGLVALDVVTALTVGRGGRFVEVADGLRYVPGGLEPVIHMFSRSGLPFTAKSVTGIDRARVYKPIICTPEALAALSGRADGRSRLVDVRTELLPMLFGEMHARYYAQVAFQIGGLADARAVRDQLRTAWAQGRLDAQVDVLGQRYGPFDPAALFFGHQPKYRDSGEYQRYVRDSLADDLREAEVPDGASPVKCAAEVFRIFRDPMRSVVEQGGLSLDSYLDFDADIRSRIHRLVAGPPALRSRQLLALIEGGVLAMPYGPAPSLGPALGATPAAPVAAGSGTALDAAGGPQPRAAAGPALEARSEQRAPIAGGPGGPAGDPGGGRTRIAATAFERPHVVDVDVVIRGRLEEPRIDGSASALLSRLYARGRLSQFRYGAVTVGSIDLTPDSHPIDIDGEPQSRLWLFGVLTEGIRHFTHYLPSPKSRIRAFEELGACVEEILG
jgi:uncharacterized NAD(P)/FAD-binding protein YdhS